MNERSVVSFSLRKLSRDNSYFTYFNSRLKTCLAYQASALLAQFFNIRNQDILINLTIILMSHESERHRYYRARSKLALGDIAQHGSSILVLVLAAQLLQDDVTFHHLSVLTFLALHGKSLALLHHSHNLSIHNYKVVGSCFKITKPFRRCLVSSTLQKYCGKQGKTILFPQLPRKTRDFGKNRAFLGKK